MRTGCLVLSLVVCMLAGCAKNIESSVGETDTLSPANGSPAASAANTMISPLI